MEVAFEQLSNADLVVDTVYKGGKISGKGSEVLSKLMPGCSNSGGFRKVMRKDGSGLPAYVVLYTSMQELAWPDFLDEETGIFRYYGDNRSPGKTILDTPRKGNLLLEFVFDCLNSRDGSIKDIPPFFVFKKTGCGWDVKFIGLAAPGNPKISPDKDLVAFWRTMNDERFQNYEAYFTVLDTNKAIDRRWLDALIYHHEDSLQYAPEAWKQFMVKGRNGIIPLIAKKIVQVPNKYDQLQSDNEGYECLRKIRSYYKTFPQGFEICAKDILEKTDERFQDFELTRPWRDGGRDALGYFVIGAGSKANPPLRIDCALEAKCYSESNSVGVREMSRLISRIRYRQFGVMVTTSYVDSQAYKEVVEDGHPILIITASDIARTLRHSSITSDNIDEWLISLNEADKQRINRISAYAEKLIKK
ncbi:restriction endonuclease [Butyrivibrio sp. INlla16]|uniref:restriction endonuclease n=1 Tax=Butyrivibrio sp. INlla16 TaxID=1520807 RepID=UPI00088C3965|nr:restriction endonuclease [Butyrivibrio sp. INlla16]SDB53902.1 Restriction endonuclease [Butyrivibrio sp. INlla16]